MKFSLLSALVILVLAAVSHQIFNKTFLGSFSCQVWGHISELEL